MNTEPTIIPSQAHSHVLPASLDTDLAALKASVSGVQASIAALDARVKALEAPVVVPPVIPSGAIVVGVGELPALIKAGVSAGATYLLRGGNHVIAGPSSGGIAWSIAKRCTILPYPGESPLIRINGRPTGVYLLAGADDSRFGVSIRGSGAVTDANGTALLGVKGAKRVTIDPLDLTLERLTSGAYSTQQHGLYLSYNVSGLVVNAINVACLSPGAGAGIHAYNNGSDAIPSGVTIDRPTVSGWKRSMQWWLSTKGLVADDLVSFDAIAYDVDCNPSYGGGTGSATFNRGKGTRGAKAPVAGVTFNGCAWPYIA